MGFLCITGRGHPVLVQGMQIYKHNATSLPRKKPADTRLPQKLGGWWKSKSPVDEWLDELQNALDYEQWERAALELDNIKELNLWCAIPGLPGRHSLTAQSFTTGATIHHRAHMIGA